MKACPGGTIGNVAHCLATVIGESGFKTRAGVAHWASLGGRPQHCHAKGACATPNEKERKKPLVLIVTVEFLQKLHIL